VHVVTADLGLCQGYGNCVMNAPGVFDLDETGMVTVLTSNVDDEDVERVRSAVAACPVSALSLRSV
jgi:ferredoxin